MTVIRSYAGAAGLLGPDPGRAEELARFRATTDRSPGLEGGELLARVEAAGLRGRGGAGFPTAVKLRGVRDRGRAGAGRSRGTVVVANGEEGEPGSIKDRHLLRARPHLVLDGLLRCAGIVGAARGFVYVSDAEAAAATRAALAERRPALPVEVAEVPRAYVAGEESSVVRFLDGGPAQPTAKPPRAYERGVGGTPTLVANVETLACVSLLASPRGDASTTLVTVAGAGRPPALYEVPAGTRLGDLAAAHGVPAIGGAMTGGLFGGVRGPDAAGLRIDDAGGAVHLLAPGECPVALAAEALAFLSAESSGQCGVCVMGTRSLAETVAGLVLGAADASALDRLAGWSERLPGRGACALLDAAAALTAALLRDFPSTVADHLAAPCDDCLARPPRAGERLRVSPDTTLEGTS
ncbi:NADH-ubiquinone oxidoreductase-F iron-sulfur binding region domain-containing protein [Actinoallomurus acanthiterrae]